MVAKIKIAAVAGLLALTGCGEWLDDGQFEKLAPNIYRDKWTGCQYIVAHGGEITPRMSRYGRQVCHNEPVDIDVVPPYRDETLVRNEAQQQ